MLLWVCDASTWIPTSTDWCRSICSIQNEEKTRIEKFVFKNDAIRALVGRLMLRRAITNTGAFKYSEIRLARTREGKPYLLNEKPADLATFNFNATHHGKYVAVAACSDSLVGVDLVRFDMTGCKDVKEFFSLMKQQFTPREWQNITRDSDPLIQLKNFHRHWALKESYIKAVSLGLGFDLQRCEFVTVPLSYNPGSKVRGTKILIDGVLNPKWTFDEYVLDDDHMMAVGMGPFSEAEGDYRNTLDMSSLSSHSRSCDGAEPWPLTDITVGALLEGTESLAVEDLQSWVVFQKKKARDW
eukprot:Colp12_sorted_trinity150504_noHs@5051